jgi:hypothetical protein
MMRLRRASVVAHAPTARLDRDSPCGVRMGVVVSRHRILQERLTEWALVEATNPDLKTATRPTFVLVQDKNSLRRRESAPTAASPTPWIRVDRRGSER